MVADYHPPPPPPTPPENRKQCSSCGFTAPASEFDRIHRACRSGLSTLLYVGTAVVVGFVLIIISKLG